jgi:hypothetical protein
MAQRCLSIYERVCNQAQRPTPAPQRLLREWVRDVCNPPTAPQEQFAQELQESMA